MAMKDLAAAIEAAERFVKVAKIAQKAQVEEEKWWKSWNEAHNSGKPMQHVNNTRVGIYRASAKRASMDLTRALADFRRSQYQ